MALPGRDLSTCARGAANSRSHHGRRLLPSVLRLVHSDAARDVQRNAAQGLAFFNEAILDVDGMLVDRGPMQTRHVHQPQWPVGLSSAGGLAGYHRRTTVPGKS